MSAAVQILEETGSALRVALASQNWEAPICSAAAVWRLPSSTSVLVPLPVMKAPSAAMMGATKG